MLVPGKVENISLAFDLSGVSLMTFPSAILKNISSVLSKHYVGRMYRIYIINAPKILSTFGDFAKLFLTPSQQQKVFFIPAGSSLTVEGGFQPSHVEKCYGGTASDLPPDQTYPYRFRLFWKIRVIFAASIVQNLIFFSSFSLFNLWVVF
jgi:hypothetical protein